MHRPTTTLTTGIRGLDGILKGLLPGDNVVWQIDDVADYAVLVDPYCRAAIRGGRRLIYFRFASHAPLTPDGVKAEIHTLHADAGFEQFVAAVHQVLDRVDRGACYLFDCLSELAVTWHSDQMLGNFFVLTCPYLYDLETITYFALFRNEHSRHAWRAIRDTTQLLLDVYRHEGSLYVRPLKVQHRYSPTMDMLHVQRGDAFVPVTASSLISDILRSSEWSGRDHVPGFWERAFIEAGEASAAGHLPQDTATRQRLFDRLARMVISRDDFMSNLIRQYLTIDDILAVRRRLIGTGLIGGKAVGMLLARAALRSTQPSLAARLEAHDSFYIGSDVFYTYLVRNGVWWIRQKQRNPRTFLDDAQDARRLIITGTFPEQTLQQLEEMLDYFGQSPFIVRSSSLLEDNFGNAFAGKYESVFCANQGPRARRLEDLLAAVRTIYASSMSERALQYRARRNLLDRDEQMALLVMRVSGDLYGNRFYPCLAGVGFSFNSYAWNRDIDPDAGVLRLVFGLGTRAVDRSDDDYTRLVALNAPMKRPEHNFDQIRRYAQQRVDFIDMEANHLTSGDAMEVIRSSPGLPQRLLLSTDRHTRDAQGQPLEVLTFDRLLAETDFARTLKGMLTALQAAYAHPVDVEFTANFGRSGDFRINLVQCRPLQVRGTEGMPEMPPDMPDARNTIISARGAVIGRGRCLTLDRLVYVVPETYARLDMQSRYAMANALGAIHRTAGAAPPPAVMLIGPGRWGTSSPSLGIPVSFADISGVAVLCEIVAMHDALVPDVSLGTHFINELVETDMLYLALFPFQTGTVIRTDLLENGRNRLPELHPGLKQWAPVVRIIDASELAGPGRCLKLAADSRAQRVTCCVAEQT